MVLDTEMDDMETPAHEQESPSPFVYKDDNGVQQPLSESDQDWLVGDVQKRFDNYSRAKSTNVQRWDEVKKAIKSVVSEAKQEQFWALVPFGKQTVQTLISHFWSRSLQTPRIFFSVRGQDEESQEMAPLHQENLSRHLEKDRARQKFDTALHLHGIPKGICLFRVDYASVSQTIYGPTEMVSKWGETSPYGDAEGSAQYSTAEQKIYEGATLRIIDPHDFVFDVDRHEDWDACWKAERQWMVYEDIAAEPNFTNYEDLKELVNVKREQIGKGQKLRKKSASTSLSDPGGIDESGRVEVIEVHGDIRLQDGTYLRNWTVVIAARRKVIRFEQNPYFINPFHKWCYEETEDGWGISPIEYILPMIDASSILLSAGVEAAMLGINPPMLAQEGHFQQKRHFLREGAIISYRPNAGLPNIPPQPIQLRYDAPFPYIQLLEGQSEATTGATRQMSGNVTTNDKAQTATEFQGLQTVGNLILDRLVDRFNLDCKIPIIQKAALINAMFNPEPKQLAMDKDDGTREFKALEPEAYFGAYDYIIEDNKSEIERKQNVAEKINLFEKGMQHPYLAQRVNAAELFKETMRDLGHGSPGKMVFDDLQYVEFLAGQMAVEEFAKIMAAKKIQELMMQEGMQTNAAITQDGQIQPVVTAEAGIAGGAGLPPAAPANQGMPGVGAGMEAA